MVDVGKRIRKLRNARKMTQEECAERIGVTKSTISSYENGSRLPSYDVLVKIAQIFKVSTDYLLGQSSGKITIDTTELTDKQLSIIQSTIEAFAEANRMKSPIEK